MTEPAPGTRDEPPDAATALTLLSTKLALDRTLLAWINTAFALGGFGFSLATFVEGLAQKGTLGEIRPDAPRRLGLTLLAVGTLALLGACIEYLRARRRLGPVPGGPSWSVVLVLALLFVGVSALMLVGALLRVGPF